jgi:hypothetical protein
MRESHGQRAFPFVPLDLLRSINVTVPNSHNEIYLILPCTIDQASLLVARVLEPLKLL